jgi:hypothetical protein
MKSNEIYNNPLESKEIHGNPWNPRKYTIILGIRRNPWKSMASKEIYNNPWNPRKSMESNEI